MAASEEDADDVLIVRVRRSAEEANLVGSDWWTEAES